MKKNIIILFLICNFNVLYSQSPGCWMWTGGIKTNNYIGNFGTKGIASSSNLPPGLYEASEWQDKHGNVWFYGGDYFNGADNLWDNLWQYNLYSKHWTWIFGTGLFNQNAKYGTQGIYSDSNSPGCRLSSPTWVDKQGFFWLYGGFSKNIAVYGDLWKYDPSSNKWAWMKGEKYNTNCFAHYGNQGIEDSLNHPSCIGEMGITWTDDIDGNLWMLDDRGCLWRYKINTNNWTWMKGDTSQSANKSIFGTKGISSISNTPGSTLYDYTRWKDSKGDFWYLYSGGSNAKILWRYQIINNTWTWIWGDTSFLASQNYNEGKCNLSNEKKIEPISRGETRSCWIDGCDNLWLFGGFSSNGSQKLNDLMFYNISSNQWTWVAGDTIQKDTSTYGTMNIASSLNFPSSRYGALPFIELNGDFGLVGGSNGNSNILIDVWSFNPDSLCSNCSKKIQPVPLKTNQMLDEKNVCVIPNPSNGNFEIKNIKDFKEILVYSLGGQLVLKKKINIDSSKFYISETGIYIIKLISEKETRTFKMTITN
jgi:Galactose oxidase, central domain/Secretion system C-terminal sorting domain